MGRRREKKQRRAESPKGPTKPMTAEVQEAIEGWAREAAEVHELSFYDIDLSGHGRWLIKVFVDRESAAPGQGISAAECVDVSRYLETLFDADDRVPERYVLEVSSPGVERKLTKPHHLDLAVGEDVELVLREPIHGKNKVVGNLRRHDDGLLEIVIAEEVHQVSWKDVARARVKFDFSDKSE